MADGLSKKERDAAKQPAMELREQEKAGKVFPVLSVVVALPEPIAVGTTISRREWPPHVTLASNFVVDASHSVLERVVREAVAGERALSIRFTGEAMFGQNHDIPVQLVESDPIVAMHHRLADALERLPKFDAEHLAFWREGYRPHMTHVAGVSTLFGTSQQLPHVAVAALDRTTATIHPAITLPREPAAR